MMVAIDEKFKIIVELLALEKSVLWQALYDAFKNLHLFLKAIFYAYVRLFFFVQKLNYLIPLIIYLCIITFLILNSSLFHNRIIRINDFWKIKKYTNN